MNRGASSFNVISVALGLAFLYLPIAILVIYSFNASRLVTIWGGWSLVWYRELLHDDAVLQAAWVSLRVAALSASAATVLGTLAAVALTRSGRFRGRLLFSGMVYAPLVMPEVITGLSLLLLFVAFDVDRGFWTIAIAHTTLTMADFREKFGFRDRGFLGCLLGVRELFGGVLPRGNVAQYHAKLLSALNATHSDMERNQPSLTHTSDRLVTGVEDTRATAVCEPVEVLER